MLEDNTWEIDIETATSVLISSDQASLNKSPSFAQLFPLILI